MFFRKVVYLQTSLSPIRGPKCTFRFFDSKRQKNKRYPFCLSTFAFLLLSYGFGYSWLLKEGNFPCQSQLTNSNNKLIVQWGAVSARRASPMLAWLMFSQALFYKTPRSILTQEKSLMLVAIAKQAPSKRLTLMAPM